MRGAAAVLFWWFLLLGRSPTVVGPFLTEPECEAIQAELPADSQVTSCWTDEQRPTVRR